MLLKVSLMKLILWISNEIKWKVESGATRSIIDEVHSSDIEQDQIEVESGAIRNIIDELHSLDIQGDQMEGGSCVNQGIIDELHSSDI